MDILRHDVSRDQTIFSLGSCCSSVIKSVWSAHFYPKMSIPGVSNVRLVISVVVIIGCFTILYPRFIHPLFAGRPKNVKPKATPPPHHGDHPPNMPPHFHDDIARQMKHGPHPGMRAAAEMNKQNTKGSGGRGGVMGMVLPVYAVGIVAYLIYTLVKVFNKQGKGEYNKKGYGSRRDHRSSQEREQLDDLRASGQQLTELENLLNKAEDKNISSEEMKDLQMRLQETERQMAKILQAMQTVSTKINDVKPNEESKEENKNEEVTSTTADEPEKAKSENEQGTSDENKPSEEKVAEEIPAKSEETGGDEDKVEEEEVVVLDDISQKQEEDSSVRHRKVHTENES